jgi:hypothetical protein
MMSKFTVRLMFVATTLHNHNKTNCPASTDPGDPETPKFRDFYLNHFGQFLSEFQTTPPPTPIFIQISDYGKPSSPVKTSSAQSCNKSHHSGNHQLCAADSAGFCFFPKCSAAQKDTLSVLRPHSLMAPPCEPCYCRKCQGALVSRKTALHHPSLMQLFPHSMSGSLWARVDLDELDLDEINSKRHRTGVI